MFTFDNFPMVIVIALVAMAWLSFLSVIIGYLIGSPNKKITSMTSGDNCKRFKICVSGVIFCQLAAGAVNALAGGGTLITFPMLVALGVPAVSANVTNTVALSPGYLGGTLAQKKDLAGQAKRLWIVLPAAALGGILGGVLVVGAIAAVPEFGGLLGFLVVAGESALEAADGAAERAAVELRSTDASAEQTMGRASQVLSRLSRHVGFVLAPDIARTSFRHVDLVPLGQRIAGDADVPAVEAVQNDRLAEHVADLKRRPRVARRDDEEHRGSAQVVPDGHAGHVAAGRRDLGRRPE